MSSKTYDVRFRPNLGKQALVDKVSQELKSIGFSFKKHKFALEWIEENGDKSMVYFINDEKYCWDSRRGWHRTAYTQTVNSAGKVSQYGDTLPYKNRETVRKDDSFFGPYY